MTLATILLNAATDAVPIEGLISDLALILILGAVTTVFFKWIKQPVVLGYIVAGFLASPHFSYLPSIASEPNIEFWAQIGIVILLFSLGLEFSFKKLLSAGASAVVTALIIIGGMMTTGIIIGHLLGFSSINSLFLGGMLSMSSTTIIIKAFNDLNQTHKKYASLVFAVLIVEDLFAVLMMVILSSIAVNNSVQGTEMLFSVAKLVFFILIWFAVGVFLLPSLLNAIRPYLNSETLLVVSMGLCLGMAVFSVACGFSLALGAFVMGSILAGTSFAERIEHVTTPVKDLFGSVFFISVGMMVNPTIISQYWGPILILSSVVIIGMIIFGSFGMLVTGQTLKVAIQSGFSLTQIGEFAFIIATLGMQLGVLDPTIYPIVVAVSVLTTFTTPYFIRMADPAYKLLERHLPAPLRFLIDRYCKSATDESETAILWRTLIRRYLWRVLLYSAVLISITLIASRWLLPTMLSFSPSWGRLLTAAITIGAMAPFLLALSYPASRKVERQRLRAAGGHFDVPLIVMTIIRLLIALFFVAYSLTSIFSLGIGITVGIVIFIMLLIIFSKRVRRRMSNIEERFLNNLNERELRRSGRNNNIVANLHLAFMTVGYGCKFVGMQLHESGIRSHYGVNIASIQRGSRTIPVPQADTRIFPGDTLAVIGTDDEIQTLIPLVEASDDTSDSATPSAPRNIRLGSVQLSQSSPLVGRSVAQSGLSSHYELLLVTMMRDGMYATPEAATIFQPADILWLVGNPKTIHSLR